MFAQVPWLAPWFLKVLNTIESSGMTMTKSEMATLPEFHTSRQQNVAPDWQR